VRQHWEHLGTGVDRAHEGSDQNGSDERFTSFAAGADVLIMHFGLSARAPDPLAQLHARPAAVGQVAQKAKAKRLVLSHFMQAFDGQDS